MIIETMSLLGSGYNCVNIEVKESVMVCSVCGDDVRVQV